MVKSNQRTKRRNNFYLLLDRLGELQEAAGGYSRSPSISNRLNLVMAAIEFTSKVDGEETAKKVLAVINSKSVEK